MDLLSLIGCAKIKEEVFLKFRKNYYSEEMMKEKLDEKKAVLSGAFIVSLLPMLLNQYGGMKGVQEITGLISLLNPIGIISVVLFIIGVWMPLKKPMFNKVLGAMGTIGIIISEIYKFFTWHIMTITGEISFQNSLMFAFPEFYIGLIVSFAMMIVYFVIVKKVKD